MGFEAAAAVASDLFVGEGAISGIGAWDAALAGAESIGGAAAATAGADALSSGGFEGIDFTGGPSAGTEAGFDTAGFEGVGNGAQAGNNFSMANFGKMLSKIGSQGNYGQLGSALNIGSGLYGLMQSRKLAARSDPFAGARAGYASQLNALEANPASITSRPGYQAGLQAVQRGQAAGGYLGSGNEMAALSQYGGQFYQNELGRLAGLAGAGATPGAGYGASAQLAGQSLASIGYGVAPSAQQPGSPAQTALLQQLFLQKQLSGG